MKQKIIYIVLLLTALHFTASSNECTRIKCCPMAEKSVQVLPNLAVKTDVIGALPVSPVSRLLFNL